MISLSIENLIHGLWIALGTIWVIGSIRSKPTIRSQATAARTIHLILLVIASILVFQSWSGFGPLGRQLYPRSAATDWIGLGMTAAGVAFAAWARFFLGGNWSATVTLKEHHTLVRGGPYALVRHPIYTGCLLAILGTAIAIGELRGFLGWTIAFATWWVKSHVEEEFMTRQFGDAYVAYRREVKALIPYVL